MCRAKINSKRVRFKGENVKITIHLLANISQFDWFPFGWFGRICAGRNCVAAGEEERCMKFNRSIWSMIINICLITGFSLCFNGFFFVGSFFSGFLYVFWTQMDFDRKKPYKNLHTTISFRTHFFLGDYEFWLKSSWMRENRQFYCWLFFVWLI